LSETRGGAWPAYQPIDWHPKGELFATTGCANFALEQRGTLCMADQSALRLWEAIEWRGGRITLNDAIFHDLEFGISKGWLDAVGIGLFEPTKELRRAAGLNAI
jgi:hypothetical protein